MIPTRFPGLSANAPSRLLLNACDAICDALFRARYAIALSALTAALMFAGSLDAQDELRAEKERAERAAERAIAERDALAEWHRNRTVRVTLEGDAAAVANLAGQVAAVTR